MERKSPADCYVEIIVTKLKHSYYKLAFHAPNGDVSEGFNKKTLTKGQLPPHELFARKSFQLSARV